MLAFTELRIDSNRHLIIDVEVTTGPNIDAQQAIYIAEVKCGFGTKIDLINLLDETILATIENSQSSSYSILSVTGDGNARPREIRYDLDLTDTTLTRVFDCINCGEKIIYVEAQADYSEVPSILEINCSLFTDLIQGYAYDKCMLVKPIFHLLESLKNKCDDLSRISNYIVQVKGLELAIESGNFNLANNYWNEFFSNNKLLTKNTECSCHQ